MSQYESRSCLPLPKSRVTDISRLRALKATRLLDTPREERFDILTRLACRLFEVPTALISLVDDKRQWFKSTQGITQRETPVEQAFCGHVVEAGSMLVVEDARQDERFKNNPLVTGGPRIRFYAGAPIYGASRMPLGSLCLIDDKPRTLSEHESDTLRCLAQLVTVEIAYGNRPIDLEPGTGNRQSLEATVTALLDRMERRHSAGAPAQLILMELLDDLLRLAGCQYGLIGEISRENDDSMLDILSMSLGEMSRQERNFFTHGGRRLSVKRIDTLTGGRFSQPQIQVFDESDFAGLDTNALPPDHPPLQNALLVPFVARGESVGVLLLANRAGGFKQAQARYLFRPLMDIGARLLASLHKEQEKDVLHATLKEFRATLDATLDLIIIFEEETRRLTYCNQGGLDQLGYSEEELYRMAPEALLEGVSPERLSNQLAPLKRGARSLRLNATVKRRDGEPLPVQATIQRIRHEESSRYNYVVVARDLRDTLQAQREIEWITHHDHLTSQLNRKGFLEALASDAPRRNDVARRQLVMVCGIDRFRRINAAHGTAVADAILQELAEVLATTLEDYPNARLGRLGGDEFAIGVNLSSNDATVDIANDLRLQVEQHCFEAVAELQLTISIGLATSVGGYVKPEELLRRANAALVQAKHQGRNRVRPYLRGMLDEASRHQTIERRLSGAFARSDFHLNFQTQWGLDDLSRPVGAEALLRWNDAELGTVGPDVFVPILEENGLMVEVGGWIIEQSLDYLATHREQLPPGFFMSVNISAIQLMDEGRLADQVMNALTKRGLPTSVLELEVTETALIQSPDWVGRQLAALYDKGVRIALDDFGTGFSSLSHLKLFPFDTVKIDKSFIAGLPDSVEDKAIVESLLTLCHGFGREVCAEGIETPEQLEFLRQRGCARVQGYLLGRPTPSLVAEKSDCLAG